MPKVIIVLLFFLCLLMLRRLYGESGFLKKLLTRELYRTYLCQMVCLKFERSFVFCLMSFGKTAFLLYKSAIGENFCGRVCSDTMSKDHTFNNIWLIGRVAIRYFYWWILICSILSFNKAICLWVVCVRHTLDDTSKTMQFGGNTIDKLSTKHFSSINHDQSFIWMEKQPCLHISSYKNCENVVAFLSLTL